MEFNLLEGSLPHLHTSTKNSKYVGPPNSFLGHLFEELPQAQGVLPEGHSASLRDLDDLEWSPVQYMAGLDVTSLLKLP